MAFEEEEKQEETQVEKPEELNDWENTVETVEAVDEPVVPNSVVDNGKSDPNLTPTTTNANDEEAGEGTSSSARGKELLPADAPLMDRMWEVITVYWPVGLIAFGGPPAHFAILKDRLVDQYGWLDEESYIELFAIGQGLPGATSTQLVISSAMSRSGPLGGVVAFFLWDLPGMIVLMVCGTLIATFVDPDNPPWYLVGLPPAAISLVFKAFYSLAVRLDHLGILLALFTCLSAILINNDARISPTSSQYVFPSLLILGGVITWADSKRAKPFSNVVTPSKGWDRESDETTKRIGIPLWVGALIFLAWAVILVMSTLLVQVWKVEDVYLDIFDTMYRVGSITFGGGQVVLPMLQDVVVPGWMTKSQFLQGLGLAQSMPGPLFNFAAYLGAVYKGVPGGFVSMLGLFGPGLILIYAVCPFWARLRHNKNFRAILQGLNATAIGLVGAACVTLWESAIGTAADAMVFSISLTMAVVFNVLAPLVVLAGGIVGAILHPDALNLGQQPYCIDQGYVNPPS